MPIPDFLRRISGYGDPTTPPFLPVGTDIMSGDEGGSMNDDAAPPAPSPAPLPPLGSPEANAATRRVLDAADQPINAPVPPQQKTAREQLLAMKPPATGSFKRQLAGGLLSLVPGVNMTNIPSEVARPGITDYMRQRQALTEQAALEHTAKQEELTEEQRQAYRENIASLREGRLASAEQRAIQRRNDIDKTYAARGGEQVQGPVGLTPIPDIEDQDHTVEQDALGRWWKVPTQAAMARMKKEAEQANWLPVSVLKSFVPEAFRQFRNPDQAKQLDQQKLPKEVVDKIIGLAQAGRTADANAELRKELAQYQRETALLVAKNRTSGVPGSTESDPKDIAGAIMRGEQSPDPKGLYRYGAAVRAELARNHYDLAAAQNDWYAVQRHIASMNSTQQLRVRQALTTLDNTLPAARAAYEQWKKTGLQSGIKVFNKATLTASTNLPGDAGKAARDLLVYVNDIIPETAYVYMGGNSPTDHALKLASNNLSADWNEKQFASALDILEKNLKIRKNSIFTSEPVGTGPNRYAEQQGGQQNPPPSTPRINTKAEYDKLPSGAEYIDAQDGKTYRKR